MREASVGIIAQGSTFGTQALAAMMLAAVDAEHLLHYFLFPVDAFHLL